MLNRKPQRYHFNSTAQESHQVFTFDRITNHDYQFFTDMKTTAFFILTVCICVVVVYASKTGVKDVSQGSVKTEGKVVVNQHCNSAAIATEIRSLKEEVKTMKKELTQRLDSKGRKEHICLT